MKVKQFSVKYHNHNTNAIFPLKFSGSSSSKGLSSSPNNGLVPRFTSRGHTYRAVVGDTLVLPCEVENLGEFIFGLSGCRRALIGGDALGARAPQAARFGLFVH